MSGKHFNELTKEYKNQGFEMYAKMTWNKMTAVNQGRQVKDREQLFFITKGRARDDMRPNNKERQKVFGLLDNEIVASRMTPEEFSEISRFVKDFSETKSENRAKKRELLEGLL